MKKKLSLLFMLLAFWAMAQPHVTTAPESRFDFVDDVGVGMVEDALNLTAALIKKFNGFGNLQTWVKNLDEVGDAQLLAKLNDLDASYFKKLDADLTNSTFKNAVENKPRLVRAWEILHDAGKPKLRKTVDALESLSNLRKNPKLSDLGITDKMLGAIEGIPKVGYAHILDDLDAAINALPNGKTVDFYKVVSDGKRGLVNAKNIWDRRHSWLTLKKIKVNEGFLKKTDMVKFEVELEKINGVTQAVPDIVVKKIDGQNIRILIGEVKAGNRIITSNFNSQCIRYFAEITDIRNLRFFRRDGVPLTKKQVIEAWKKGGVLNEKVFKLFKKYDEEVTQTFTLNNKSQLENYLIKNSEWFNLIFNSHFK